MAASRVATQPPVTTSRVSAFVPAPFLLFLHRPRVSSCAQTSLPCSSITHAAMLPRLATPHGLAQCHRWSLPNNWLLRALPSATVQSRTAAASTSSDSDSPWLIVGLGNPGMQYENTRHNVGFMVVEALAKSHGIDVRKLEKSAAVGRGVLQGQKVILARPVTFMNNSGESVSALAKFYKIPSTRILVVSDDLDQDTGVVKLKQRGGHGGHNGLRSIMQRLGGTQDFPRLKVGIGRPTGQLPVAEYVLQSFRQAERTEIDNAIYEGTKIIESVLALGLEKALSGVRV